MAETSERSDLLTPAAAVTLAMTVLLNGVVNRDVTRPGADPMYFAAGATLALNGLAFVYAAERDTARDPRIRRVADLLLGLLSRVLGIVAAVALGVILCFRAGSAAGLGFICAAGLCILAVAVPEMIAGYLALGAFGVEKLWERRGRTPPAAATWLSRTLLGRSRPTRSRAEPPMVAEPDPKPLASITGSGLQITVPSEGLPTSLGEGSPQSEPRASQTSE